MFLNLLNEDKKMLFLALANNLAQVDGKFSDEERLMIQSYCKEMEIHFNMETEKDIKNIISDLGNLCDEKEKKIIIFEVIGLAMVDKKYDSSEKSLIIDMINKFGISSDFAKECESVIIQYLSIQEKINELIMG